MSLCLWRGWILPVLLLTCILPYRNDSVNAMRHTPKSTPQSATVPRAESCQSAAEAARPLPVNSLNTLAGIVGRRATRPRGDLVSNQARRRCDTSLPGPGRAVDDDRRTDGRTAGGNREMTN